MTTISDLVTAVVTNTKIDFPGLVACEALAGYIETTSIDTIHANTPGFYVTSVGSGEIIAVENEMRDVTVQMVAYLILVNSQDSLQREEDTEILISNLLAYIGWNRWGLSNVHPASAVESTDVHGLTQNFQPHVKDWRLGVSVLARAADLYGGNNPISNLALWAITWEQRVRMGIDAFDIGGPNPPNNVYVPADNGTEYIIFTHVAMDLIWSEQASGGGQLTGTLTIIKAADETSITHYAVYWGSSPTAKLSGVDAITLLTVTGNDIDYYFAGIAIPNAAGYLIVHARDEGLEYEESQYLDITVLGA